MLQRLWRSIQRLWQKWFGRGQKAQPEVVRSVSSLPNKDYESVLRELLDRLTAENWGRADVLGFLFARSMSEAELAAWLPRLGDRFLESNEPDLEFARKLVRLGAIGGQLGTVAEAIGRRELGRQKIAETEEKATPDSDSAEQASFWFDRGVQQFKAGDLKGAIASWDKALVIKPDMHEAWYNRGAALVGLGQYEEAIASYDKALDIKPDMHEAWHGRGIALANLERYEESIDSYDEALVIKPDDYESWNNRGIALFHLGGYEEAIASFDKALSVKPDYHEAWHNRGSALAGLGRYEEAIASYDKALDIKPDMHEVWHGRGIALANLERYEESIDSYDKALDIKPDEHGAWYGRGDAFVELGHYEEAIESYDKALEIKLDYHEAWGNRGNAFSSLGRYKEAIKSYGKVLEIKPGDHKAWYNRGVALTNLGHYEEAIESCDKALSIKLNKYEAWIGRGTATGCSSQCKTKVLLSLPQAMQNTALDQRGYQGQLNTLHEGLKYVRREEQPEGWGKLHYAVGKANYFEGRYKPDADRYFRKAIQSYCTALETLTPEAFPEAHLEVMLDRIRAERGLGNTEAVKQHTEQSLAVLQDLLNQASPLRKRQLERKFSGFRQFTVDRLIAENQLELALREAERNKNRGLSWILDEWQEPQWIPEYAEIQQLLNESTAIVYWHHSPSQISTFILKPNSPPEILPIDGEQQFRQFEDWLKGWNSDYRDYRSLKKTDRSPARKSHSWRTKLTTRLDELKAILGIPAIESQLPQAIQHLILVPHRDLHRLPLHALLSDRFTVTYLPSLQIGLSLQTQPDVRIDRQTPLLSVEDPNRADTPPLKFAELESALIAQLFQTIDRLSDREATEAKVIAALQANSSQTQQIFHFTGHAEYNDRQPQYSSLGLTGTDRLTAQKIIRDLDLNRFSLVCLSACETSITGMATIDSEYVGLPSALLQKGVTLVLSTLWTVDEITNAWMMIRFYQEILAGKPPALSLQQAQHWLQTVDRPALAAWLFDLSQTPGLSAGIRERFRQYGAIVQANSREDNSEDSLKDSSTIGVSLPPYDPYHWAGFTLTGKGTL